MIWKLSFLTRISSIHVYLTSSMSLKSRIFFPVQIIIQMICLLNRSFKLVPITELSLTHSVFSLIYLIFILVFVDAIYDSWLIRQQSRVIAFVYVHYLNIKQIHVEINYDDDHLASILLNYDIKQIWNIYLPERMKLYK